MQVTSNKDLQIKLPDIAEALAGKGSSELQIVSGNQVIGKLKLSRVSLANSSPCPLAGRLFD